MGERDSFNGTTGANFVVARYSAVGMIDTSFQTTGIVETDLVGGDEVTLGGALQPVDGKIVAAGMAITVNGNDFALVRVNP